MNGYLLDTNVVSEFNRAQMPHPRVVQWFERTSEAQFHISVLTLAEIEKGILILDEGKKRRDPQQWFESELKARFSGRILPLDEAVASQWARFVAALLKQGRPLPTIDSLLMATALAHRLTLVTRNTKDFATLGVDLINPWQEP